MTPIPRPIKVCLLHPPADAALESLRHQLDGTVQICLGMDRLDPDCGVLVHGRPTRELLASCPRLSALIVPYAGVPAETRALLLELRPELPVYNLHHNAAAVSELAMALFLAAAKTLLPVDRRLRSNDWRSRYDGAPLVLLEGKTALILGAGAIGSRLARMCASFRMQVLGVRKRAERSNPAFDELHGLAEMGALLPRADALFVALPLTPETEGLLGRKELYSLPPSCVLVNIARGTIIDEEALFLALRDRRIAAAGLDVWYAYPSTPESRENTPPSRFPFHELDNVVMSPHRGGAFQLEELERARMAHLALVLNALARGEVPPDRVDLQAGY